jgi:hypothetical protein
MTVDVSVTAYKAIYETCQEGVMSRYKMNAAGYQEM